MKTSLNTKNEIILNDRFVLLEKLGVGSFGSIYKALDKTNNQEYAIKFEKLKQKNTMLYKESRILQKLNSKENFAKMIFYKETDEFIFLVMSCLGSNLEDVLNKCGGSFSIKTTFLIAYQIIMRLEALHSINYIHRDIKPENFVIGSKKNERETIFLIDFGLSKSFIEENEHIPFRDKKGMVGTARYASRHTHLGIEQSRRDDFEAVGYLLVFKKLLKYY